MVEQLVYGYRDKVPTAIARPPISKYNLNNLLQLKSKYAFTNARNCYVGENTISRDYSDFVECLCEGQISIIDN